LSITVQHISKIYGTQRAVNNINFHINEGEIVGFLGPNGAGKTTTMKILTGFVPQSEGEAKVCDLDVRQHPLATRKNIGYLPEHNPLYLDMYVKEYLTFVSKVHRIDNIKNRVAEIIELTGLQIEQRKKIGQLSKGYRQRVGLASALVHNPKVLILDEPTTGLDPNQLSEIRSLIKSLGENKTLIFSTHIMQEVEAVCDRVIIIDEGKIVADDSVQALQHKGTKNIYAIEFLPSEQKNVLDQLKQIPHIDEVMVKGEAMFECHSSSSEDIRPAIFNFAVNNNLTLIGLSRKSNSLEDVFKKLTQKNDA